MRVNVPSPDLTLTSARQSPPNLRISQNLTPANPNHSPLLLQFMNLEEHTELS
jgi:hypothetical protein